MVLTMVKAKTARTRWRRPKNGDKLKKLIKHKKVNQLKPKKPQRHKKAIDISAFQRGRKAGYQAGEQNGYQRGLQDGHDRKAQERYQQSDGQHDVPVTPNLEIPSMDALVITSGYIASLEIGIVQPLNELVRQDGLRYLVKTEGEVTREWIESAKTIIFLRNVEPRAYQFLEWAHEMGKPTIYVIDDHFADISANTEVGRYYLQPSIQATYIKFLQNALTIKVDAPYFGELIREHYNGNVIYFPASVDFEWIDQVAKPERQDGRIVIGYAGGVKEEAFAPIVPALLNILAFYGGFVTLEFFGYIPAGLIGHPSVAYIAGGTDYRSYIQRLNQCTWDIGLAPLEPSLFNNCKSNNKFRDYSACMIPGMYSSLPAYQNWITHGETGYMMTSHSPEAWYAGIKEMIENPEMRQRIQKNAAIFARQQFTVEECANQWRKIL